MAYVDRFIFRFSSVSGKAVRITIADNDYTGAAVERRLGGSPQLRCELSGNIHGMSLEIPAECKVDDEFAVLYTSDPTRFAVRLEVDNVVVWRGFVTPELYAAPWVDPPYDVQITATDGLGELKMMEWPAIGSRTLKEILDTVLGATGLALGIRMISAAANDIAAAEDLLTGTTVNLDHMAGKSYYDVLDGLLGSLHCTISQRNGVWLLVRETDVTSLTSGGQVSDTSGNTYPVKSFGSSQTHDCWPVGRLTTEIVPAKSVVEVECPNKLAALITDPDMELNLWQTNGSWTGEDGGYYTLDLGEYISQTASVANATRDADPGFRIKVSSRNTTPFDVGIMRLTVMTTGRDPRSGSDKTLYLKEVTTQGRTQMEWVAEESHFNDGLGMPKTLDHQDCKEFVTDIFRLPTGLNPIKTITIRVSSGRNTVCVHSVNIECMSVYDKAVTRLLMDNGARGDESYSPLFADSFAGNKGNFLLSNSPKGVTGALVGTWSSEAIPSVPYGEWLSKDMALSVATPRLRMSGRLFTVTSLPALFYSNKGLSYITEEWSLDLLEDEADISLISLPAAALSTVSVSVIVEDNDGRKGTVSGGEIVSPKTGDSSSGSGYLDWFIAESYEEDGETKYRLKLNPKYVGMYAEGWVSAGGVSEQGGGGGGTGYLRDLLDVNASMSPTQGQALVWDDALGKWTAGDVSVDLTPFERIANRVTTVSSSSNHTQYPTAKAVYDIVNTMLSSVLRSQGITTTPITNGSTTNPIIIDGKGSYTASEGDVVIRDDLGLEFMWTGGKWRQFGDESSYALKTVTITGSGYLTGGGNLEAARTIDIADAVKTKIDNGATAFSYFTDGAANEAIKLRAARKLWGQSFDGTADISGYMSGMSGLLVGESTTPSLGTMEGATALGIKSATERYGLWEWVTGNGTAHLQSGRGQGNAQAFPICLQELGGNVGIGTPNPSYKLDVIGIGSFNGAVYANLYNGLGNKAGGAIVINKDGDYFGIGAAPSNVSDLAFGLTSDAAGTWKSIFGVIGNNGNVGLGTTSLTYRLNVDGIIRAEKLIGTATGITETTLENEEFAFQATPVQDTADGYRIEKIKGYAFALNQTSPVSSASLSSQSIYGNVNYPMSLTYGRKYLIRGTFSGVNSNIGFGLGDVGYFLTQGVSTTFSSDGVKSVIGTFTSVSGASGKRLIIMSLTASTVSVTVSNLQVFDLTLMFGEGKEPSTVEEFEALFPEAYYDYTAGELINNSAEAIETEAADSSWTSRLALGLGSIKVKDSNGNILEFNGLASAGDVYDEIVGKKLTDRFVRLDLGTPAWTKSSLSNSNRDVYLTPWPSEAKPPASSYTVANMICPIFTVVTQAATWAPGNIGYYNGSLGITVSRGSYATVADFQSAMSGVMAYIERTTPVTYELVSPVPLSGRIDGNGTMRVISDGPVAPFRGDITYGCNPGQMGADASSVKSYLDTMLEIKVVNGQPVLHSKLPLYSDSWISAGGLSDTGEEGGATYLKNLLDVDDNLVESAGYGLVYDGTQWTSEQIVPASRKINGVTLTSDVSLSLGSLSNVSVTGATSGQQLIYNGSEWIAGVPAGAKFFHGTCSTSSSSNTKVVDCPSFTSADLVAGTAIAIVMYNRSDTTSTVTINVNGTGANTLLAGFANRKAWSAGELILAVYDGSGDWDMLPTWYYTYYYGGGGSGGGGGTGSTVVVTPRLSSGTRIATITVDGSATDLYAPSLSVTQTQGSTGGTQIASINSTAIYAPAVTVTQVQTSGVEVARIKVGSANPVSIFAPSGSSGSSGVQTVVGRTGDVTTDQIATALTNAGYKLTDTVQDLSGYLPLTAGSSKALTNTLYTRGLLPTANASYDLGSLSAAYNNTYTKRVYLADGVYIEYDSTNRCVYVHGAGIATDSFVSAGGVSTTSN